MALREGNAEACLVILKSNYYVLTDLTTLAIRSSEIMAISPFGQAMLQAFDEAFALGLRSLIALVFC